MIQTGFWKRSFLTGAAGLLVTGASSGSAQAPVDLARQHLESGIQFYEQERYNQALNDFRIIVTSMADTEYADDAMLRIGRYYLEIEEDFDEARTNFEAVLRSYPTGNAAPGAYYYLGETLLRADRGGTGIDDALANFQRVFLYPENPWIPSALYSTGLALERQGKFQDAVDAFFQVIVDHAGSPASAGAQLGIGRSFVRLGEPIEAMRQFQEVRNQHPGTAEAESALDWLTLLFRFYGAPMLGRPITYRHDPSFNPTMRDDFDDVEALRLSEEGVHLLERGEDRLLTFSRDGQFAGSRPAVDPYGLFVDPRGELVIAVEKALIIDGRPMTFSVPGDDGPEQLEKIRWAVRDRLGEYYIYDDDERKIFRFRPDGGLIGPFPDSAERRVLSIEIDQVGNIIVLEERDRIVTVYAPTGTPIARIQTERPPLDFDKAVDIALDPAGYLYILDEDEGRIAVYDASYELVTQLSEQNLGPGVLDEPVTLDVDASGDLYVYDDDEKKIFRLR